MPLLASRETDHDGTPCAYSVRVPPRTLQRVAPLLRCRRVNVYDAAGGDVVLAEEVGTIASWRVTTLPVVAHVYSVTASPHCHGIAWRDAGNADRGTLTPP